MINKHNTYYKPYGIYWINGSINIYFMRTTIKRLLYDW